MSTGELEHRGEGHEPLVSVVIPCFNQAHFLSEAVESIRHQSYARIETFVIDDGSTDNTRRVAERFPDVQYRHQTHRGAPAARNRGIAESKGRLLVFLDADDRLLEWAVEAGVSAFRGDRGAACAIGACRDIGPGGQVLEAPDQPLVHRDHYSALLKSCFILSGSSVLFSRWCLQAVGGFDASYATADDYDLYLRIARRFPMLCHGRVITEYRRHSDSLTGDPVRTLDGELRALRRQRGTVQSRGERAALRSGRRKARSEHCEALRRRLCAQAQSRDWRGALRSAGALLRNRPGVLASAAGDIWIVGLTALRSRRRGGALAWRQKHGL